MMNWARGFVIIFACVTVGVSVLCVLTVAFVYLIGCAAEWRWIAAPEAGITWQGARFVLIMSAGIGLYAAIALPLSDRV